MSSVDISDVKAVRDALANLPPNYMKAAATKHITVQQAISNNKSGTALSRKTQDKYFTMFRQLLIWAVDEGYIVKVPGQGVKVAGVGKSNPAERRHPYSTEQLKRIFSSPLYTGHKSEKCRHEPGQAVIRDGKFWVPLIALYSGMRMGEIVQLLVADIRQEAGVWYFDVNEGEEDEKALKTDSSKRRVPVHSVLIEAGLLGLVKQKSAGDRIFTDIQRGNDGYFSHNFSKWYGRYSRKIGAHTSKTAFHSFRHTFKDALQRAEVQEYISKALLGHADKSVHSQYGSGPGLKVLQQAVEAVAYEIDLSFLLGGLKQNPHTTHL